MIKVLFQEGCCANEIEMEPYRDEFTAQACLDWYTKDRVDAADWDVMDDMLLAGIEFVQIGENIEGETVTFYHIPEVIE